MNDDTARLKRAKDWADTQSAWTSLRVAYLAGAREEAAINATELNALRQEVAALQEAVRLIAPRKCSVCDGSGWIGEFRGGRKVSCEYCGGHEDGLGAGYTENPDVEYAEWMARPGVRRALESKP